MGFLKWFAGAVFAVVCLCAYILVNLHLLLGNLAKIALFNQLRSWMKDDSDSKKS